MLARVKGIQDVERTIPAAKVTEHRHLDSPSKRETLLPYLNVTASQRQKAEEPPQRSKFGDI